MAKTVVYFSPDCSHCHEAMSYLSEKGIDFDRRNIRDDPEAAEEAKGMGEGRLPIIVIDGHTVTGFDKEKIDLFLRTENAPTK